MPFEDLAAFIRPGFDLPVLGRTYYVPPPNARDGAWLQALIDGVESMVLTSAVGAANKAVLVNDEQERTAYQIALGGAYAQMSDDGVPWPVLKHAGWTAWMYWTRGQAAAEQYWSQFGDGPGKATATETAPTSGDTPPEDPSTPPPA